MFPGIIQNCFHSFSKALNGSVKFRTTSQISPASSNVRQSFAQLVVGASVNSSMLCRAALHRLLVFIIRDHDQMNQGSGGTEVSPTIEKSTATIKENLRQPPQ